MKSKQKMQKAAALLTLICCLFMTSCGTVKFEYKDGMLVNTKDKSTYNALPTGFEPCGVGKAVGEYGAFTLYTVLTPSGDEMPTDVWLTEQYSGNATTVYLSSKENVPSFRKIQFDKCYVCIEDENVMAVAEIDGKENIDAIISSLDTSSRALWPRTDIVTSYSLKLHSESLAPIFYSLVYCVCESGNYLYDRASGVCVDVGGLLEDAVPGIAG